MDVEVTPQVLSPMRCGPSTSSAGFPTRDPISLSFDRLHLKRTICCLAQLPVPSPTQCDQISPASTSMEGASPASTVSCSVFVLMRWIVVLVRNCRCQLFFATARERSRCHWFALLIVVSLVSLVSMPLLATLVIVSHLNIRLCACRRL